MITKAQIKHIRSLDDKKYRNTCHSFVVENPKLVNEIFESNFLIKNLYCTNFFFEENNQKIKKSNIQFTIVTEDELKKISFLQTPQQVLCEVEIPKEIKIDTIKFEKTICLALDKIQDPGNLGTIIRIADWYGIENIICSKDCVDVFNPKVVQATMGSLFRTKVIYNDLVELLSNNKINSYGTTLNGKNLKTFSTIKNGVIIIGNEGKGICDEVLDLTRHKIKIEGKGKAESLNAAIATGIVCSWLVDC